MTKTSNRLFHLCAAIALLLVSSTTSSAQILYNQLISTNPIRYQLRQVNGDGSGDTAFGLPFTNPVLPSWSRDAGVFAISATDPNRPNDPTVNVYTINPANGAVLQQLTFNELFFDPQTGAFRYTLNLYKAFSPDRGAMAISSLIRSSDGQVGQNRADPVLGVISTANPGAFTFVRVYPSERNTFLHHGGEGVDWHPAQNVLVAPVDWSAPYQSDPSLSGGVTALLLLDPVDNAVQRGRFRQITFPRTDQNPGVFKWGEHDYLPRFSPNGVGVAYVRSFQNFFFSRGGYDPNVQSLRILNVNTGAETEVRTFSAGSYISSLDWSPDGTALIFDIGQQANGINGLEQNAIAETREIYIINVDGTGLRRLRGPGAGGGAWKPFTATPPPSPRQLLNISNRMQVGTDPNQLIGGFIITGSEPKKVVILATGPSLAAFNIPGVLEDPILQLYQGQTLFASNDNWEVPDKAEIEATGFQPSHRLESALVRTLPPGDYTAVVRGTNGTGVGTVQVYDLAAGSNSKLANISSRGRVEPGDDKALIGGFIVEGNGGADSRVIIRALGPSLSAFQIAGPLSDPTLDLKDANGSTLLSNDDWQQSPQEAEIRARNFAPSDFRESVVVASPPPGAYTAIVRGKGDATGVAVVEVYNLD